MSDRQTFTILLVDDNDVIQEACGAYLEQQGYRVLAARDGREALSKLEEAEVDAVLLDVMMPGLSGFEVLERLRERWPPEELPVIMATAKDQNADVIQAFSLGASDYVTKPLDYPVLSVRLRAQLRSKMQTRDPSPPRVMAEDLAIQTGAVLDGKYRLESLISQGKFGIVYQARHVALDRLVAIKLLGRDVSGGERRLRRFRSEGISACRIDHHNAVSVLDSSVTATGVPFLVMELLQGETLDKEMRRRGRLPAPRCAEIILPICDVLGESHALGIVHRDIKPSNIFLHRSRQGEVIKVLDFGIATLADEAEEQEGTWENDGEISSGRSIVGTPIYMAPERFSGEKPEGRTDVYSLGVVLYEMLAGQLPFGKLDGNPIKVMHQHLHEDPVPLATLCPELPAELCDLVHEALAKSPARRPTASQLARRLAASLGLDPPVAAGALEPSPSSQARD